jgi:tungstate transport system permease protein
MNGQIAPIVIRSFLVSGSAALLAGAMAVPTAVFLSLHDFRGKKTLVIMAHSLLSIPAVFIGLCCYLLFTRSGPMGPLRLLYTPYAMILAQAVLAAPISLTLVYSGLRSVAKPLRDTLLTLGAGHSQMFLSLLFERRRQVLTAMIMAFSRVVGETGMTMMVGGNIRGATRVMTTTMALETMKGNFELAIALGGILLAVAVLLNVMFHLLVREHHALTL